MATRTIKPKRDDNMLTDWQSMPEVAPSATRAEGSVVAQILLFVGFFLSLVGVLSMVAPLVPWTFPLRPGLGFMSLTIGLAMILYHCHVDSEPQFRRLYGLATLLTLAIAIGIRLFPFAAGRGAYFLSVGVPLLFVSLLFIIGIVRAETDPFWRKLFRSILLGLSVLGLVYGVARGFFDQEFLVAEGVLVIILGFLYLAAFIGLANQAENDIAHFVTIGLGVVGALVFAAAVVVSWSKESFFIPSGLILCTAGFVATTFSYFAVSERPTFILVRRELMAYFSSPIAYLVLIGLIFIFGFNFYIFRDSVLSEMRGGLFEPIVSLYVVNFFSVIAMLVLVPILTMRLLSEEKRSGSLELLLTAPLGEVSIVLGKFLAAWIFFLIAWSPFFLYMVGFRIFSDADFDYRPLLSFFLALAVTGAGFMAFGLFCSSLTSNQIIAAVLTFAGVLLATGFYWLGFMFPTVGLRDLFKYMSFIELWIETSKGFLPIRFFVFHITVAIFFLYLTVMSLGSRKWK